MGGSNNKTHIAFAITGYNLESIQLWGGKIFKWQNQKKKKCITNKIQSQDKINKPLKTIYLSFQKSFGHS